MWVVRKWFRTRGRHATGGEVRLRMAIDFDAMTWTCMVCGDERPNAAIGVVQHEVEHDGQIIPGATYNQRYCVDRPACTSAAHQPGPYRLGSPQS